MKKLILTFAIIFGTIIFAQSQQVNFPEGTMLVYSDTNALAGGDTLIRSIYSFVPQKTSDTTYEFQYKRIEFYTGENIHINKFISQEGAWDETITIGGNTYTLEAVYNLIISINAANWKTGTWQFFLQKINNE